MVHLHYPIPTPIQFWIPMPITMYFKRKIKWKGMGAELILKYHYESEYHSGSESDNVNEP